MPTVVVVVGAGVAKVVVVVVAIVVEGVRGSYSSGEGSSYNIGSVSE